MFSLSEDDIAAIRAAFDGGGELAAAVELRRLYPGIADLGHARRCVQSIVGWAAPAGPARAGPGRPGHRFKPGGRARGRS